MNTRGVIGKKIVRVEQARSWNGNHNNFVWDVQRIWLEDGSFIYPLTIETDWGEYAVEMGHVKHPKEED
jgi:hypothetical protein